MSMSSVSDQKAGRNQKRMRKGTQSCTECRERKVRCVFSPGRSDCDDCRRRGKTCIEQKHKEQPSSDTESTKNVRQYLSDIDSTVKHILRKVDSISYSSHPVNGQQATQNDLERLQVELVRSATQSASTSPDELGMFPDEAQDHGESRIPVFSNGKVPLLSLLDNTVLKGCHVDGLSGIKSHLGPSSATQTRSATGKLLRALIPKVPDLVLIVLASERVRDAWHGVLPVTPDNPDGGINANVPLEAQLSQVLNTENTATLVKFLFVLAICIQQLPRDFNFTQISLTASLDTLQSQYLLAAESVLAVEPNLASTIDGLECMLIQMKYYINMGKPRTAWLIGQRALSTCYVFGVYGQLEGSVTPLRLRWETVWLQFWGRDRQLSLLLGLPCAGSIVEPDLVLNLSINGTKQGRRAFWKNLGIIASRIIDRNQNPSTKMTFSLTLDIDHEMDSFKQSMPTDWWGALPDPQMPLQAVEDIYLSKFIFHNIRKLLHLPFMLKAMADKRYEYSRDATLDASREMIKIYRILHGSSRRVPSICNLEDFHLFTAALILIINLLDPSQTHYKRESPETIGDWGFVQDAANILKRISGERACGVATQGGNLLEDFLKARYSFPGTDVGVYEAVIPYFGRISLTRSYEPATDFSGGALVYQVAGGEQHLPSQAGGNFEFDPNPVIAQTDLTQPYLGNFYNWTADGADWPTLGDDLHIDWSNFGQQP